MLYCIVSFFFTSNFHKILRIFVEKMWQLEKRYAILFDEFDAVLHTYEINGHHTGERMLW